MSHFPAFFTRAENHRYQASVPAGPVTYGLSAAGPNVMLVTPPEDATGALPLYHISISMDVLSPRTLVTTIRRGGTLDGPFVAEFEARQTPARVKIPDERVYMRDRDHLLQDALKKSRTQIRAETYGWQLARDDIIWERKMSLSERGSYTGYIVRDRQQIKVAQVRKAPSRRLPGSRYRQTHLLEVTPEGHAIFDDLLVSLLIIEQQANLH
ncbi:hypothetical protein BD626DRAFT_196710 [Schizophyllum amplum]|uniref:DUF6593 domain-containing protein n=1 Tax=Schizophyllum amplum TaxID=97359 RepID=A0A550CMR7_9AGAR|nr:hypothetical protein BD626DRAFT_196710 [Auriculariopsis ampla]